MDVMHKGVFAKIKTIFFNKNCKCVLKNITFILISFVVDKQAN